jgi:hypothetical protein
MKFKKKEQNDYIFNILVYIFFVVVSSIMIGFGLYRDEPATVVAGVMVIGVSVLIPLLATVSICLIAVRGSRKKILRNIKKKHSDKTITDESK